MNAKMKEQIESLILDPDLESGPVLTDSEIQEFEAHLGVEFPDPYREFLKTFGNLTYGDGILGSAQPGWLAQPSVIEPTDELRHFYQGSFHKSLVAICPDGGGNYWCLVCEGSDKGKVVFWQHDVAPAEVYPHSPTDDPSFW